MLEPEDYIQRFLPIAQTIVPNLTHEELKKIVRAPFVMLSKAMAHDNWPTIRFKYWGIYKVKPRKAREYKFIVRRAMENKTISEQQGMTTLAAIDRIIENSKLNNTNDES